MELRSVRTVLRDDRIDVQDDDGDVAHGERVCEELADSGCA